MTDTAMQGIAWAREGMELSLIFLAIRLGLKQVTIEERYKLKLRAERFHMYNQEMQKK
jgi:hypothetical protein